ncbi:MAG: phytanoyl-CoA dioxygenase family protein [Pseudomonadota bacterium]
MDKGPLRDAQRDWWFDTASGDVEDFIALAERQTSITDWPNASRIDAGIPVYDGTAVSAAAASAEGARVLMAEWARLLETGPGVLAISGAVPLDVLDRATETFEAQIDAEKSAGGGGGDHFAKPGANDRVWNAIQKHCVVDPENFARYYASDAIALAARAWLGPGYQITAQVNRVNPGGAAQTAHRDYHLGFMSAEAAGAYPAQVHRLSPFLTLQGAVAHVDMPVESGPTMLLPHSQVFPEGYVAFERPEFQEIFAQHHVQLPLEKGDAVFFNPALMHGAGTNRSTDIRRMANLLQVSSAFGRAMESVDRPAMQSALYPVLLGLKTTGALDDRALGNAIAAAAEGYAFPTNLDNDPPVGGLAPASAAARMWSALAAGTPPEIYLEAETAAERRRLP